MAANIIGKIKSNRTRIMSVFLSTVILFSALFPTAWTQKAYAEDFTSGMYFYTTSMGLLEGISEGTYEAEDGSVAYCGNPSLDGPGASGTWYDAGWSYVDAGLANILYYGYPYASNGDGTTNMNGIWYYDYDARMLTQYAIWVYLGYIDEDGTYTNGRNVKDLLNERHGESFWNGVIWLVHRYDEGDIAPESFLQTVRIYDSVTSNGLARQPMIYCPDVGTLELVKASSNASITSGNDCYSLEGAQYGVYASWDDANSRSNAVTIMTTDADGWAGSDDLSPGDYYVREISAPEGYWPDETIYEVTVTSGETSYVNGGTVYDVPANDPVQLLVAKYDGEKTYTASNLPQGSASLAGAEFTIEYYDTLDYDSYEELTDAGVEPTRSWVVATNENGYASLHENYLVSGDGLYYHNGIPVLPRGTVVIYESKAPEGYLVNDEVSFQKIQEDPASSFITYNTVETPEQVYRSDFELVKQSDNGSSALSGVAFKVTSTTTGESHVIVTDENGYFSSESSWNAHSNNTNGNDWALDVDGVIDSDDLDATAGIWFGYNTVCDDEGNVTLGDTLAVDDALGALPYDVYTIEELRCTNNEGYALVSTTVTISRDGAVVDLGTLTDPEVEIGTTAMDALDNDSYIGVGTVKIVDKVSYSHLVAGRTYNLVGELYNAETGEAIIDDGVPVAASTTFTAENSYGTATVEFTLDTYDYPGATFVVFETLMDDGGSVIAEHKDLDDTSQQVTVYEPEIGTQASDGHDGDNTVIADSETTVIDTVSYSGLTVGETYTVTGTLMVKSYDDDGNVIEEVLLANGEEVTAQAEFVAESVSGTVEVAFTFDSSALPDESTIVVFETLYHDGIEIAVHADIEDEGQTIVVRVPGIGTTATDGLDGDKTVIADSETTVNDAIEYSNLLTGEVYTVIGMLVDAETGLPILDGDGGQRYSDEDLTAFLDALLACLVQEDGTNVADDDAVMAELVDEAVDMVAEAVGGSGGIVLPAELDPDSLAALLEEYSDLMDYLVTQSDEFVPAAYDGTVDMGFTFDSNSVIDRLSGETKDVVVFEVLLRGSLDSDELPTVVAYEADVDNEDQTVTLTPSSIGTTATDASDGDHELLPGEDAVIVDEVAYEGLIPGKEYMLHAVLYDKETGEPLTVDDQTVTAELRFTPNSQNGTVSIDLGPFDASSLDGHDLVVFEELYKQSLTEEEPEDVLVAEHKDIEDEGQTVTVTSSPSGSVYGKTGGNLYPVIIAIAVLAALAGGCAFYALRRRKMNTQAADAVLADPTADAGLETPPTDEMPDDRQ